MADLIGTNFIREKTGKSNRIWPTKIITWVILKKQRETHTQENIPNHLHVFGIAKPTHVDKKYFFFVFVFVLRNKPTQIKESE